MSHWKCGGMNYVLCIYILRVNDNTGNDPESRDHVAGFVAITATTSNIFHVRCDVMVVALLGSLNQPWIYTEYKKIP